MLASTNPQYLYTISSYEKLLHMVYYFPILEYIQNNGRKLAWLEKEWPN